MTTQHDYYASTAYDSRNKRELPPIDRPKMKWGERYVRKFPLTTRGCHCNEYLATLGYEEIVEELQELEQSDYQEILNSYHSIFEWETMKNKKYLVESIVFMAWWFWSFGSFIMFFLGLVGGFDIVFLYLVLTFVGAPFLIWCLGKLAIARGWITDSNNIEFNRQTGMITFTWKKDRISLPFDEFDPYILSAKRIKNIGLVHHYSEKNIVFPESFNTLWQLQKSWEQIQCLMDISQPLPDIPQFDIVRANDPVSNEYDKKHHRPKDYWKTQEVDKVEEMITISIRSCKKFPWGKTREQAIQDGWQPSGYGEGDWQNTKKDNAA